MAEYFKYLLQGAVKKILIKLFVAPVSLTVP